MAIKKSNLIAGTVAVVTVLWLLSGVILPGGHEKAPEAAGQEDQGALPAQKSLTAVRVRTLKAEEVSAALVVTGRTEASRQVDLRAETDGVITQIVTEKGEAATAGQVLALIEERDRKARVGEASERLRQREIEYNAARELETKGFNSKVRLAQARADLEQARAELKNAENDLGNVTIKAPFEGVIFEQHIEIGDYVSRGDMVFSIVDLDPVEVSGFVTERQVGQIALGREAQIQMVDGSKAKGIVSYIAPAADEQTRTFGIEITVPNAAGKIAQGMTAQIFIATPPRKAHKISPAVLSLADDGTIGVKIVDAENRARFVPVMILSDNPDHMLVGGLPEQVRLITVGQEFVADGEQVAPQESAGDGLL